MKTAQQQQVPPPRRMDIGSVTTGRLVKPDRVLIFGTEGVGKSTWAASAPDPIFIPCEDGTANLDVARFPEPETWPDLLTALSVLTTEKHVYKTAVVDTVDAAESMLWRYICDRDGKDSIEAYGYGKGYTAALDEWRVFMAAVERLQRERKMGVILVAHSWIKTFKNPEGEDFDRYELKLHAKASGLLKEWCEDVLFAHYETFAVKDDKNGKAKGVSSGARVVHTQRTAAWDAKNRHALPEMLPLSYEDFAAAVRAGRPADPEKLKASIAEKLSSISDPDLVAKVTAALTKAGDDASALSKIENRLNATLNASAKGA